MSDSVENPNEPADSEDAASSDGAEGAAPVAGDSGAAPSELELLSAERSKLKDQLLRTMADFDNFRKRARRDAEDALRRGREDTLRDVLSVIDNLERAVEASRGATDVSAVLSGVEMVLRNFEDVANRMGVERVKSVGERFDPTMHDAIQQVESAEHPPGTVVAEAVPGYRIGDRLLRAAMVMVSKAPAAPPAPEPAQADETDDAQ